MITSSKSIPVHHSPAMIIY